MSLRINQNINARKAHRYLQQNNEKLSKSLERLSSGFKITRAADGPASLVSSEQMRAQIGGLDQAILNTEVGVSMVQTTESALNEVNRLLVSMRQLSIHAANDGANDEIMLQADQTDLKSALGSIDRISSDTEFGKKKLLDGSNGVNGVSTGADLEYVSASTVTQASSAQGYDVKITQNASRPSISGNVNLTKDMIRNGETLQVLEGGKAVSYTTNDFDTVDTVVQNFRAKIEKANLDVEVKINGEGNIFFRHKDYGSSHNEFSVSSSTDGVLSKTGGEFQEAKQGKDIAGTINGESALGSGQILTGISGAKSVENLELRYLGQADLRLRNRNGDMITEEGGVLLSNGQQVIERLPVNPANPDQEIDPVVGSITADGKLFVDGKEVGMADDIKSVSDYSAPSDPQLLKRSDTEEGVSVGKVVVTQNSLNFQVGPNPNQAVGLSLLNTSSQALAQGVRNKSNYKSLADLDVRTAQGALDALRLIDTAIDEITTSRSELGAFQKNTLESGLINLRIASENMTSAESVIRDADMAGELAKFTRDKIMFQSGTSMLKQANEIPKSIIRLLT